MTHVLGRRMHVLALFTLKRVGVAVAAKAAVRSDCKLLRTSISVESYLRYKRSLLLANDLNTNAITQVQRSTVL